MTRRRLFVLWLINLAVLGYLVFSMWARYQEVRPAVPAGAAEISTELDVSTATAVIPSTGTTEVSNATLVSNEVATADGPAVSTAAPISPAAGGAKRRVVFSYRDPRCKEASITGGFTSWRPTPMIKGPSGVWTYSTELSPGDHSYNLIVDGRTYRDPSNPRTDSQRRSLKTVSAGQ